MRFLSSMSAAAATMALAGGASAQLAVGSGPVAEQYESLCAACHASGGQGGSLFDGDWKHGSSPEEIASSIRNGITGAGMPAFASLNDDEIRSLVIFIQERTELDATGGLVAEGSDTPDGTYKTAGATFTARTIHTADDVIWGVETIPGGEGALLITLKGGVLRHIAPDGTTRDVTGTPDITPMGQGGLLDVAVGPTHADDGWVYLAFADVVGEDEERSAMTKIVRGRLTDDPAWTDEEVIFEAPQETYIDTGYHFGTRMTFDGEGHLFFSIGDRGRQDMAQDTSVPNGKVHRITVDGTVPEDNPFADDPEAFPTIWSYGNRNPQGLFYDPHRQALLEIEHGPRGGDEFNIIEAGRNYGWPAITYGMNYDGTPITGQTARAGMEQPVTYWVPSLAVSSIAPYDADLFSAWQGDILIGGLAAQELRRLAFDGDTVTEQEVLMKNRGRVRDLHVGPDGRVYLAMTEASEADETTARLVVLSPRD